MEPSRHFRTFLTEKFNLRYPIILAPMFLVSNAKMMIAAHKAGIIGCLPAQNYRTLEELSTTLTKLDNDKIPYGINLIVNQSNPFWEKQFEIILNSKCRFILTSLGNPSEVIKKSHAKNILVFCDVTDTFYAKKVEALGADAIFAVNSGAGGHLGKIPASILVPMLKKECKIPVIAAGGVGSGSGVLSMLALGTEGASIGSPFLASTESPISPEYKNACLNYGAEDIVTSTKISGTPCTVINTPYVQKIGTSQSWFEKLLYKNKKLKKYIRMLTYYRGMKLLEKAAFQASYQTVWCAGPSIEFSNKEESIEIIVNRIAKELETSQIELKNKFS